MASTATTSTESSLIDDQLIEAWNFIEVSLNEVRAVSISSEVADMTRHCLGDGILLLGSSQVEASRYDWQEKRQHISHAELYTTY